MLGIVLTPGLVAAGVGSLIFVGLDTWTGFGTFSLAVPNIPHFGSPDVAEFLWALGIGLAGGGRRYAHPPIGAASSRRSSCGEG